MSIVPHAVVGCDTCIVITPIEVLISVSDFDHCISRIQRKQTWRTYFIVHIALVTKLSTSIYDLLLTHVCHFHHHPHHQSFPQIWHLSKCSCLNLGSRIHEICLEIFRLYNEQFVSSSGINIATDLDREFLIVCGNSLQFRWVPFDSKT